MTFGNVLEGTHELSPSRRGLIIASSLLLLKPTAALGRMRPDALEDLERLHGGRLGVHVHDLETGRRLGRRSDERFKLQSTFKGLLAALILSDVSAGRERLDTMLAFGAADLLPASPVTSARVREGAMSIVDLCEAIMHRSDNAAANILMRRAGGPTRLTRFLRRIGDGATRVDSYEGDMNGKPTAFDTSNPRAITTTVEHLMTGPILPAEQRLLLERWMAGNEVGRTRLRAVFPDGWRSGDRTGTADGYCNDYAFARRPQRRPIVMAAYYHADGMELQDQEAVLRSVAETVVAWQRV